MTNRSGPNNLQFLPTPSLAFGITVHSESLNQLTSCLHSLRIIYPSSPVFVVSDGAKSIEYGEIATRFGASFVHGERLKMPAKGAQWWHRFFQLAYQLPTDFAFKVDPDCRFHRKFAFFPCCDVFGTKEGAGSSAKIQGGIQGFTASAVQRILTSSICVDPCWENTESWATNHSVRRYLKSTGQVSTDYLLMKIVARVGLRIGDWREVDSQWKPIRPFRDGVAATHPHKVFDA